MSYLPLTQFHQPQILQHKNTHIGHIYTFFSTVPDRYLYWFKVPHKKELTVTGESKAQLFSQYHNALQHSDIERASLLAVELHCSGYFHQAFNLLIEMVGSHIHIHNPNLATILAEQHRRLKKFLNAPKNAGTMTFPERGKEKAFFASAEVRRYRSTLNCQPVRNFVIESTALICLSHQKEMTFPKVDSKEVNLDHLSHAAKTFGVGGKRPMRFAMKHEFVLTLAIIEKCLLFKNVKVEKAIYWILWLLKLEGKYKKSKQKIRYPKMRVNGVAKKQSDHWVWNIWKSVFKRVALEEPFRKQQIMDIYYLFKVQYSKSMLVRRLPLLFYAMRLLSYRGGGGLSPLANQFHIYIKACANVNILYRNLQIRLASRSWANTLTQEEFKTKIELTKPKKSKRNSKKEKEERKNMLLDKRVSYLNVVITKEPS